MTIKPTSDRIVLKTEKPEESTQGGIILTASAKEKPMVATVIAVGPGSKDEPMTIKVGDRVVTAKYGGTEVTLDGETYNIVRQSDVLAIVE